MATIKFINSKGSLKRIIDYVTQDEKTDETLVSGKDCVGTNAMLEMDMIKNLYNKQGGRTYLHVIQSFDPKDNLTHHQANNIGQKLSQEFEGFQVLVVTHKDREHIHNHLIVNTVNFDNGKKLHQSKHDLQRIKDFSDKLCLENNLSIITEKKYTSDIKQAEYQQAIKGESWKFKLMGDIDNVMENSTCKADFITQMNNLGYDVNWTDSRKYITYTTPDNKKCRDIKLHDQKYLKENMEYEYRRIEAEESSKFTATYELPTYRGNLRKDTNDTGSTRPVEDSRTTKMYDKQGDNPTDSCGASERTKDGNGIDGEKIERSTKILSGRGTNNNSQGDSNRGIDRNSALDNALFLAMTLNKSNSRKNSTYKSGDLSKQAKKEYAITQESKGFDWEEEDEWER